MGIYAASATWQSLRPGGKITTQIGYAEADTEEEAKKNFQNRITESDPETWENFFQFGGKLIILTEEIPQEIIDTPRHKPWPSRPGIRRPVVPPTQGGGTEAI